MDFSLIDRGQRHPTEGRNHAYLRIDYWNDFSFVTMFDVVLFDSAGRRYELGSVKIGFRGQSSSEPTYSNLSGPFPSLPPAFFSLGQDVRYYSILKNEVPEALADAYLAGMKDIAANEEIYEIAKTEDVFKTSLTRDVSISSIKGQFKRVLQGGVVLTDYDFEFKIPRTEKTAEIVLSFKVDAESRPSTNVHALIGRNGVGKTTILNEMINSIMRKDGTASRFTEKTFFSSTEIAEGYFSSLVSVSFSAFDPFAPPPENSEASEGARYTYIGLKDIDDGDGVLLKSLREMREECVASLGECFSDQGRTARWKGAIETLQSDGNFARMNLTNLAEIAREPNFKAEAMSIVERMSSGHAVVLLTISKLVSRVEEKTLVLLDEPESHLHPPLLSAFTRALSELLFSRNGVGIVATHSPVVLQELPRSCVQVITRIRLEAHVDRPQIETFGENVGSLTREVFGLEVIESGYHALLKKDVSSGAKYEEIVDRYAGQLGLEARGMLRAMISERDEGLSL